MSQAKSSASRSREREMATVLRAQESSGLTTAEFARREGLSARLLYTWRHRLAGRKPGRRRRDSSLGRHQPVALIPVDVRLPDRGQEPESRITLELCSGDKIHVPAGASQDQVESLIGVLRRCS